MRLALMLLLAATLVFISIVSWPFLHEEKMSTVPPIMMMGDCVWPVMNRESASFDPLDITGCVVIHERLPAGSVTITYPRKRKPGDY